MKYKLLLVSLLICTVAGTSARGQWVQANGPYGGTVRCLVIGGSTLFAGVVAGLNNETGGVFRSTDDGANWTATSMFGHGITALGLLGTTVFADATGKGLYRSTNNGTDWTLIDSGMTNANEFAAMGSILFMIAGNYVYRSTDSGFTWSPKSGASVHRVIISQQQSLLMAPSSS